MFTGEIRRARSKRPYYIALGFVVVVVAIVLLIPMPFTVKSTFELAPVTTVEVIAPRDGVIAEVPVARGVVGRGSIIAKYDIAAAELQVPTLEKQIEQLEKPPVARPNPKVKANLKKAEAALKAADATLEKAKTAAKGKQTPALATAQKKQLAATAAMEKARAAVGLSKEEREQQLTAAKAALEAVKAELASVNIYAPDSGALTLTGLEKGKAVTKGEKLAVVADNTKLKAIVKVPAGETIKKGQGVELVLPRGKWRVLFDSDAKGDVAEAMFDNAKGELSVGLKGEANIEGTQRSIVSR